MLRNLSYAALALALTAGIGYAKPSTSTKVVIPVPRTSAASGKQMYANYCAPCHGVDGRGQGPMAAALRKQPANLASLSRNHGGKFPASHILSVLEFGPGASSHGKAEMPAWGPVLASLDRTNAEPNARDLRIDNLSRFLQSLQAK
ncbi:MAG: c-type cytochrome [Terracidiphilus sp.]